MIMLNFPVGKNTLLQIAFSAILPTGLCLESNENAFYKNIHTKNFPFFMVLYEKSKISFTSEFLYLYFL